MNIFVLDLDPNLSAKYHCDKHVVKMILETAQLLSTVAYKQGWWREGMYKPTHKNHPCTLWAESSTVNLFWLIRLGLALCDEYQHRYGRIHKSRSIIDLVVSLLPENFSEKETPSTFALAMPDQYKNTDPVVSYRSYYVGEKLKFAKYKNTPWPSFLRIGDD